MFGEDFESAMIVQTQAEADVIFEALLLQYDAEGLAREISIPVLRRNLGYYAGYFGPATRERVERLFNCEHPVFGKWAENGTPTAEEALRLGIELGETWPNRIA